MNSSSPESLRSPMRHLFSPAGERELAELMKRGPLLAFDLDGTLAPIVARPEDARVPLPLARRLAALAQRLPLAVITGRRVADARLRLGFEPRYLIGNHGAEGLDWRPPDQALALQRQRLEAEGAALAAAGVQLEDKGLSLALHYRLAGDRAAAQALIERLLAELPPELESFGGKCVANIVQRSAPDKGIAVEALLRHCERDALLFVGDDVNDESVFVRARAGWLTVRVGTEPAGSRAMFFLGAFAEVGLLLEKMQQHLLPPPHS